MVLGNGHVRMDLAFNNKHDVTVGMIVQTIQMRIIASQVRPNTNETQFTKMHYTLFRTNLHIRRDSTFFFVIYSYYLSKSEFMQATITDGKRRKFRQIYLSLIDRLQSWGVDLQKRRLYPRLSAL